MKKFFAVLALVGVMTSCKDKKKEETKTDETSTNTPTDATTTPTDNTSTLANVPTFADPEVQKFVNEYSAFVLAYKKGIVDPAQAQALQKTAQEWTTRMIPIAQKLAADPVELQKWQDWWASVAKELMPPTNK